MYALKAKFVTLKETQKESYEKVATQIHNKVEIQSLVNSKSAKPKSRLHLWVQNKIVR